MDVIVGRSTHKAMWMMCTALKINVRLFCL